MSLVNRAFGRELQYEDVYSHLTTPDKVYLMTYENDVVAMAGYSKKVLSGVPSIYVDGVTVDPKIQGRKVFRNLTKRAVDGEKILCLRTQNPFMYKAVQNYCSAVYPNGSEMPSGIRKVMEDLARSLGSKIDGNGVVPGHFGGLFYGKEPTHHTISRFFRENLKMDLYRGDAVLVVGVI